MIEQFRGRYYFLSNFYECEIEHQGIKYPSVEHFYVAMKCNNGQMFDGTYFTPGDFREFIATISKPAFVKKIGQSIIVRSDWNSKKLEFMNWGIREKFKNELLKEMLISTNDIVIVENNYWHDNYWGQCSCDKCIGKGKNHLGKILMQVRDELRGTQKKGLEELFK